MSGVGFPECSTHPLRHVAIIMDGNGRWAKAQGLSRLAGHRAGVERVREVLDACREHGIEVATLFAFSSENWQRPGEEVQGLMALFATYLRRERNDLVRRGVSLRVVGGRDRFSPRLCRLIDRVEEATAGGSLRLNLAVDYGGRWIQIDERRTRSGHLGCTGPAPGAGSHDAWAEINYASPADAHVDEALVARHLCLAEVPPPDLCIRTAGEQRISNFLLWQFAYTEFYFADCLWPDFDAAAFRGAVAEYQGRQRRFGRTAEIAPELSRCSRRG